MSACVIVGAGDAIGAAATRRFGAAGLHVVPARRSADKLEGLAAELRALGQAVTPIACDARDEDQVADLFRRVESEIGPIEVVVFNIGANVSASIFEETARKYRKIWELCAFAGFLTGREAARVMAPRGRGTLIFTGATASVRGGSGFAAFAGGKHALRALAQSLARELGPLGVHVAHVVIDGAVDTAFIRDLFPDRYALKAVDGILNPAHVADAFFALHAQPRDAWSFEIDLRPYMERW
jgi:NAD(P)-dependent dehydrogenase (short-subunit alcohol dehydrogenase family)